MATLSLGGDEAGGEGEGALGGEEVVVSGPEQSAGSVSSPLVDWEISVVRERGERWLN